MSKYNIGLKTFLQEGLPKPEYLVYKFRRIVGKNYFSVQFKKFVTRYKRIGNSMDILRQTTCMVVNPIMCFIVMFHR